MLSFAFYSVLMMVEVGTSLLCFSYLSRRDFLETTTSLHLSVHHHHQSQSSRQSINMWNNNSQTSHLIHHSGFKVLPGRQFNFGNARGNWNSRFAKVSGLVSARPVVVLRDLCFYIYPAARHVPSPSMQIWYYRVRLIQRQRNCRTGSWP